MPTPEPRAKVQRRSDSKQSAGAKTLRYFARCYIIRTPCLLRGNAPSAPISPMYSRNLFSAVYARRREFQRARDQKEEIAEISVALKMAREVERDAERAYREHIEKHGCKI